MKNRYFLLVLLSFIFVVSYNQNRISLNLPNPCAETSIDNAKDEAHVLIYPNPCRSNTVLLLSSNFLNKEVNIYFYDLQSRLIFSKRLLVKTLSMDMNVSSYPAGLYILEVTNNSSVITQKLIIQ